MTTPKILRNHRGTHRKILKTGHSRRLAILIARRPTVQLIVYIQKCLRRKKGPGPVPYHLPGTYNFPVKNIETSLDRNQVRMIKFEIQDSFCFIAYSLLFFLNSFFKESNKKIQKQNSLRRQNNTLYIFQYVLISYSYGLSCYFVTVRAHSIRHNMVIPSYIIISVTK